MSKAALKGKKIGMIGCGNMGRALVLGMLKGGLLPKTSLLVSDVLADKRDALAREAGIAVVADNEVLGADILVLAVKPQAMGDLLKVMAGGLREDQLIISIAAGVKLARLEKALANNPVIRVMPNTPALVGEGISAVCAGVRAGKDHLKAAHAILGSVGESLDVPEAWMDAVTATSGSGPAYVYYFLESMISAAEELGISPDVAGKLVRQTFAGALSLLAQSGESPEVLRARVTSPGGTTEAGIEALEAKGTRGIIAQALLAAAKRGQELSEPS